MVQGIANKHIQDSKKWLENYVDHWVEHYRKQTSEGEVASYIPSLSQVDPNQLGITIVDKNGRSISGGDTDQTFTIQSISKVFSFIVVCMQRGINYVLERVDVEPTGEAFNSIMHLEMSQVKKPFNPMVNAGAITVTSMLLGKSSDEKFNGILQLLEQILGRRLNINVEAYESERDTSVRNRAIGYYLVEMGDLESDLSITLDAYFKQCSIDITVDDLARLSMIIANDGEEPETEEEIIPPQIARLAKAIMLTCGMYNASGKFAVYVGIPAKSGVSGGIMALAPPRYRKEKLPFLEGCGIGVYGPALNKEGNSAAGIRLLKHIAEDWDLSLF